VHITERFIVYWVSVSRHATSWSKHHIKKQTTPSPWREADSLLTSQEILLLGLFAFGLCPSRNVTDNTKI
jgi:hypothetical protein